MDWLDDVLDRVTRKTQSILDRDKTIETVEVSVEEHDPYQNHNRTMRVVISRNSVQEGNDGTT